MDNTLYKKILYFIIVTISLTLMVQLYWNYKNYQKNLQGFQNDVQISLDNALDIYYANLTEKNHMTFIDLGAMDNSAEDIVELIDKIGMDSIYQSFEADYSKEIDSVTQIFDTDEGEQAFTFSKFSGKVSNLKVVRGKKAADSVRLLKNITSIYISIQNDSLKLNALSPLIKTELQRKSLNIPFALEYQGKDTINNTLNENIIKTDYFKTDAKSKFLKSEESLLMFYPNATKLVLRQGIAGILISTLLFSGIVACLIYLLKVIKQQKQLAEIKNDLISNITHEFKTPIATIGVALEGIKNFNGIDDKTKTKRYLDMSTDQLSKLNLMVEKLLETATLDSEFLEIHKERVNLSEVLKNIIEKMVNQNPDKNISFYIEENCFATADVFHFENAVNNLLDNAMKYGGNIIALSLISKKTHLELSVLDDGNSLQNVHKDQIFEKFYRVPKGNTHDVRGFGIGLYYTKTIIEKHGGTINLELKQNHTNFIISLPND